MGLAEAWRQLKQGKFGDAFSYSMVSDEVIQADRDADLRLAALNTERASRGYYDAETYALMQGRLSAGSIDAALTSPETSPLAGAQEAIDDRINAAAAAIQSGSTWTVSSLLKLIPWPVWLALIGYGLFMAWPIVGPALRRTLKLH
jgi:hypothetical protein